MVLFATNINRIRDQPSVFRWQYISEGENLECRVLTWLWSLKTSTQVATGRGRDGGQRLLRQGGVSLLPHTPESGLLPSVLLFC